MPPYVSNVRLARQSCLSCNRNSCASKLQRTLSKLRNFFVSSCSPGWLSCPNPEEKGQALEQHQVAQYRNILWFEIYNAPILFQRLFLRVLRCEVRWLRSPFRPDLSEGNILMCVSSWFIPILFYNTILHAKSAWIWSTTTKDIASCNSIVDVCWDDLLRYPSFTRGAVLITINSVVVSGSAHRHLRSFSC